MSVYASVSACGESEYICKTGRLTETGIKKDERKEWVRDSNYKRVMMRTVLGRKCRINSD